MTVARSVTYRPLISDELSLTGETFEHPIGFKSVDDNGNVQIKTDSVCIYVPKAVRDTDDRSVGETYETIVFWTANNAVLDTVLNDTITHALRYSADFANCVLISLPAPGDHAADDLPLSTADFFVFSDEEIALCFAAAGLKGKPGNVRLASHSRGHRGLTRTLMGNNLIGHKKARERLPETGTISTSFIDPRNVIKIVYFDNFFFSAERIVADLVAKGLSNEVLYVYRVTDGERESEIRNTSIFKDKTRQFIDLSSMGQIAGSAIGCTRYINEEIAIVKALGEFTLPLTNRISKNKGLAELLETKKLPPRRTFSTVNPLPDDKVSMKEFSKKINFSGSEEQLLRRFLNSEQILRASGFDMRLAAHHLFVCEFIEEIFF